MDKKNTFYAFLATGAFATIGGLVGIFSKLLAVLFSAPHDTIQFIGSMVLTVLCLATALSAFGVLLFAMRKIKKISEQEQKQIALLKSKLASITPEGDVVIDNGKMVVDLSNKNGNSQKVIRTTFPHIYSFLYGNFRINKPSQPIAFAISC